MARDEFWELTPRELYDEIEAIRLRQQDAFDRDITLAWHIEALHRQKRLPGLTTLLSRRVARQTKAEQRVMLQQLSEQYRIPLRVGGKAQPLPAREKPSIEDLPANQRRRRPLRRDLPAHTGAPQPPRVKARPRGR